MRITRSAARAALEKKKKTMEDSTHFRILDLPPELVEQIFGHLMEPDEDALLAARLVCRVFRDLSFKSFGSKYFEHLVVMLHPLSLAVLLEISNHCKLAPYVRQITVSGERIGGVINMLGHADEQEHKDLQTSMLNSKMDRLILTDIFYTLYTLNLSVVRIDNESFRSNPFPGVPRCGSRYIFKGLTAPNWRLSADELNPAIDVVTTSLMDADATPCIEMAIDIRTPFCEEFFDPTCDKWKSDFADNIMDLVLSGEVNSEWSFNLLRSTNQLNALEINFAVGLVRLSHPETGMLRWPLLLRLQLEGVFCDGKDLENFLHAHKNTLRYLTLSEVHLMSGSWKEMLALWRKEMILRHLILSVITETTAPTPHIQAFWDSLSKLEILPPLTIDISTSDQIRATLEAILHDFRTTDFRHSVGYLGSPMYRVDFRLAYAMEMNRAEIRDGQCHLLEH